MINILLWSIAGFLALGLVLFWGGLIYASIYDAWYQRKYAAWIALQEDHNQIQHPMAK